MQIESLLVPSNLKINRMFALKVRLRYEPVRYRSKWLFACSLEDITHTHARVIHRLARRYRSDSHRWPGRCPPRICGPPHLLPSIEEESESKHHRY